MWKLHWQFHLVNCRSNSKTVLAFLRPWHNLVALGKLQEALRHQNEKQLSVNVFVKVIFPWGAGEMVGRQTRGMGCLPYSALSSLEPYDFLDPLVTLPPIDCFYVLLNAVCSQLGRSMCALQLPSLAVRWSGFLTVSWCGTCLCASYQAARSTWEEATVCPSVQQLFSCGCSGKLYGCAPQHPARRLQIQSLVNHRAVRRKQSGAAVSCCFPPRLLYIFSEHKGPKLHLKSCSLSLLLHLALFKLTFQINTCVIWL